MGLSLPVLPPPLPPSLAANCLGMDLYLKVYFSAERTELDEFKDRLASLANPFYSTPVKDCVSPVIPLQYAGQNPTDTLMGKIYSPPSLTSPSAIRTINYATLCAEGKIHIGHLRSM